MAAIDDFAAYRVFITQKIKSNGATDNSRTKGIDHRKIETDLLDTIEGLLLLLDAGADYDEVSITDATTAITAPPAGKIKYIELNVDADSVFTGMPAPSNSRKKYVIIQRRERLAKFSVSIDGNAAGVDDVFTVAGQRIVIADITGGYKIVG